MMTGKRHQIHSTEKLPLEYREQSVKMWKWYLYHKCQHFYTRLPFDWHNLQVRFLNKDLSLMYWKKYHWYQLEYWYEDTTKCWTDNRMFSSTADNELEHECGLFTHTYYA